MDTLTHGLLGAAVGALPLPRQILARDDSRQAARAAVLAGVLAAQLPDIDYLLPAGDAVLRTLKAHRGLTHALIAAPVVALVAAALSRLVFRETRLGPLYVRALVAVPIAHLLPDLWTGWGTRLFLPFSDARIALDWTMVIDPFFTLPLAVGAGYALWLDRARWRNALMLGLAVSGIYLGLRIASGQYLVGVVRAAYPGAASVHVFPAPLAVAGWRYVARFDGEYVAGSIALGSPSEEEARVASTPAGPVPRSLAMAPTVREALAWARFPVVRVEQVDGGGHRIEIADLRYHLRGLPTLAFVITVAGDGVVTDARLERGGSIGELFRRWRGERP